MRAYVFVERVRGFGFWELEESIADCRRMTELGIKATTSLWGQYDMLIVIERESEREIRTSIRSIVQECSRGARSLISNTTTMVVCSPTQDLLTTNECCYTVLAIDVAAGHDESVWKKLAPKDKEPVVCCDMVLGAHDIIVLVRQDPPHENQPMTSAAYYEFLNNVVDKQSAIEKTRTMFGIPQQRRVKPKSERGKR